MPLARWTARLPGAIRVLPLVASGARLVASGERLRGRAGPNILVRALSTESAVRSDATTCNVRSSRGPPRRYAQQPELMQHSQNIATQHGLYHNACFNAKCTGMVWDEERGMCVP